jgi:hypothetical protein
MYSRRRFGKTSVYGLALSALPALRLWGAAVDSTVKGVRLGAITGSLGPLNAIPGKDSIDLVMEQCMQTGVGCVELGNGFIQQPRVQGGAVGGQAPATKTPEYEKSREELRQWRLTTPPDHFQQIRKRFDDGGVNLYSMSQTFADDFTDAEIDSTFKQIQALGLTLFQTNQTRVSMGPRMAPYGEKYKIQPAWHTHAMAEDPNEVGSPDSLQKLLGMSKMFMVCLDIGHYFDGGNDPYAYFEKHHDRITHLHIKDRKKGAGSVELGTGELHIREMLTEVRDRRYPIAFILERDFRGTGTPVEETRNQMDYMRRILES